MQYIHIVLCWLAYWYILFNFLCLNVIFQASITLVRLLQLTFYAKIMFRLEYNYHQVGFITLYILHKYYTMLFEVIVLYVT